MIDRREALGAIAATLVGAPAVLRRRFTVFGQGSTEYSVRAVTLMEEATVVDLLNQFMFAHQVKDGLPKLVRWMTQSGAFTPADADLFRSSGIHVFCLGSGVSSDSTWAVRFFADWNSFIAAYPEYLLRVDDSSDFERARRERKIGIMLTSQESGHLKTREDVDLFFSLGQRVSQLTYNYANQLGSGFLENRDGGLTALGQSILTRMEAVGMAADLSHCGDQTTLDALAAARRPVLFTHASCRTLMSGHLRTKTDEMIPEWLRPGGSSVFLLFDSWCGIASPWIWATLSITSTTFASWLGSSTWLLAAMSTSLAMPQLRPSAHRRFHSPAPLSRPRTPNACASTAILSIRVPA